MGKFRIYAAMRKLQARMPLGNFMLLLGFVALTIVAGSPALGQPAAKDLLAPLNLSAYPPGMRPPPFTGQTVAGREMSLAELMGRVILVNFWATWCSACRPEMPMLEQLHRDFRPQGLTVLGINYNEGAQIIQQYAKELDLTFPLLMDPNGEITRSYGIVGLPTTFLIGRDGRPVALAVGVREWSSATGRAIIRALLAEPATQRNRNE